MYSSQYQSRTPSGYPTGSVAYGTYHYQGSPYSESATYSEQANKRARLDPDLYNHTPTGQHGEPSSRHRTFESASCQSLARNGYGSQLSTKLERQVRGLAQYSNDTPPLSNNTTAFESPSGPAPLGRLPQGLEYSPSGEILPQRGAPPGTILNLACEYCDRKKRKCPRDWPCSECKKDGQTCVPKLRKYQRPKPPSEETADQHSESESDANEETEGGGATGARKKKQPDGSKRKEIVKMGPVVGGYQEWSNMRLEYRPFPPDLDQVREKLFHLEKPLLLNSQQWADYWPHMTGVYNRQVGPKKQPNGTFLEMWECRNHKARRLKGFEGNGTGKRKRATKSYLLDSEEACTVRFRIIYHIKHADTEEGHNFGLGGCRCLPEWALVERSGKSAAEDAKHNHTIDTMDRFKRSDGIIFFAAQKVQEGGYSSAAVAKWVRQKYSNATTQIQYLGKSDVANCVKFWRRQNPDLVLIEFIPDEDPAVEARKRALDLVGAATTDSLRKVLTEVFMQLPAAMDIVLPFLETEPEVEHTTEAGSSRITEGEDIRVPHPGLPKFYGGTRWSAVDDNLAVTNYSPSDTAVGTRLVPLVEQSATRFPLPLELSRGRPHPSQQPQSTSPAQTTAPYPRPSELIRMGAHISQQPKPRPAPKPKAPQPALAEASLAEVPLPPRPTWDPKLVTPTLVTHGSAGLSTTIQSAPRPTASAPPATAAPPPPAQPQPRPSWAA